MMIKRAYLAGERDGEQLVQIVKPGEAKTAGILPAVQSFIDALTPDPRYTYVLVNAMGNSWYYGPNSNRDWYGLNPHLELDGLLNAWDGIGADVEADKMKAKDWPYGYPSFYNAAVYAHHRNTDPAQLGFGDVIYAGYNHTMKRVELVERVFNDEARKKGHLSILQRLASGDRVDVSMGAKIPFDLCSVCSDWDAVRAALRTFDPGKHRHPFVAVLAAHKVKPIRGLAITRADYCKDMVERPGQILPDGRKVFVYNDAPRFFDISFVLIGADRTARVMWFMGPEVEQTAPPVMRTQLLLNAILGKVAGVRVAMDKEIPGGIAEAVHQDDATAPDISSTLIAVVRPQQDKTQAVKQVLAALSALGIVLSPREFQHLVLSQMPGGDLISQVLDERNAVFSLGGGIDTSLKISAADYDADITHALAPLMGERSSFGPYWAQRTAAPVTKQAAPNLSELRTPLLDKISAQYNSYRLDLLENAEDLFPKVAVEINTDLLANVGKTVGLASLLLSLGPMISLVSSHLRQSRDEGQQLGTMASIVANNPSFATITTIGAALRAAMGIEEAGGLAQAAKKVVTALGAI